MIAALCVDDRNGLRFNGRRQSRDRAQLADLLRLCREGPLWMSPESGTLFPGEARVRTAPDFWAQAGPGEICFFEDRPPAGVLDRAEAVVLYRWNRDYPADVHLDWDGAAAGFSLTERTEFPGYSHRTITRERYERGADHGKT